MIKNKNHTIVTPNYNRFTRMIIWCMVLCFNYFYSQQSSQISIHYTNKKESLASESAVHIEQGATIYDYSKEENTTLEAEKNFSTKTSAQATMYVTEGAYIVAIENSLTSKIVEVKTLKKSSIAQNSIKKKNIPSEKTVFKNNIQKSIAPKTLFRSAENQSHFSHHTHKKNIGISTNNTYYKGKKIILVQSEYFSKNSFSFHPTQNHQYAILFHALLVFENYFARPPPTIV